MPRTITTKQDQERDAADARDRAQTAARRVDLIKRVVDLTIGGLSDVQIAREIGVSEAQVGALLRDGLKGGGLTTGEIASARRLELARVDRVWSSIYAHHAHITQPRRGTAPDGSPIVLPGPVDTKVAAALLQWSQHRARLMGLDDPNILHAEVATHAGGENTWAAERTRVIAEHPDLLEQFLAMENRVRDLLAERGIGFVEAEPSADDFMNLD